MPEPETLRTRRRAEIVAVARKIVAEEGLEALTFGALEARLDFTRGVITYHFKNKDDIVHAVLDDAIADINAATRARLKDDLGAEERLEVVLRTYVRGFIERQDAVRVLLSFWGRLSSDKKARKANAAVYASYRRGAKRMLEEAIDAGQARAVDVDAMAALLVGIVIGISTQVHFDGGSIDPDAAVDQAVAAVWSRLKK